jgi:hypothetical protein
MRLGLAFTTFFRILFNRDYSTQIRHLSLPTPQPDPERERAALMGEQLRLLGMLQRDGRLIDFLMEDLSGYSDDQIGSAVRDIHRDCKAVLTRHLQMAAVIDQDEDTSVDVREGYNPSSIRLTGNVKGSPPHRGVLAHRGWKVTAIDLPTRAEGADGTILCPAEVEIS